VVLRYIFFWPVLAVLAVANGVLRQTTYGGHVPELTAHQISTVTGTALIGAAVWILNRYWPIESAREAVIIGACWLVMTVLFEFGFGHFVAGHSWSTLIADYNLLDGRIWAIFLVALALMPYVVFRLTGD
jgi:hypothetical protein